MININIFYLHNGFQFDEETIQRHQSSGFLGRPPLPLETLLQLSEDPEQGYAIDPDMCQFNVVNDGATAQLKTDNQITIVPIDYQSFPISNETREYYTLSDFGKEIDATVKTILALNMPNTVLLFYTSTEPYFFDSNIYFAELGSANPDIKIIVSGSGETTDHHGHYERHFKRIKNVTMIPKLWYLDRVHWATVISDNKLINQSHIKLNETEYPKVVTDRNMEPAPNKFLLTTRNCRSHRLMFGTMIENSRHGISDITYGRFYSMAPNALYRISKLASEEYPYYIELFAKALQDIIAEEDVDDVFLAKCVKSLLELPHYIDMMDINDRGVPGAWLYKDCDIVIAPGGEAKGYGYVDEKQMIPMFFKKPFITFGCKGLYEELKKVHFKVFEDCWPIEFNTYDTLYERVQGAFNVIEYIRSLDSYTWNQLVKKTEEDVEHNYQMCMSGSFRRPSNNNFFKEVIEHASN